MTVGESVMLDLLGEDPYAVCARLSTLVRWNP
jgi:hypothetical protein